jgi:hypothetical protein
MGKSGHQTISDWERGLRPIPGPVQVAMEHLANCQNGARKLLAMKAPGTSYERRCLEGQHDGCTEFKIITLSLKRGMELQKEIG